MSESSKTKTQTVECANCGDTFEQDEIHPLEEVVDLNLRLDPGSEVPAGECPHCGALCYLIRTEPIIVRICDGFAGSVVIPEYLKGKCTVEIRNFDTDGCADLELDELDREEGEPYFCTVWK